MHKDDGASESESCRPRGSFCLVEGGEGVRSLGWWGGGKEEGARGKPRNDLLDAEV